MEVRVYISFDAFSKHKFSYSRKFDGIDNVPMIFSAMKCLYGDSVIIEFVCV